MRESTSSTTNDSIAASKPERRWLVMARTWLLPRPGAKIAVVVAALAWLIVSAQLLFFALFQPIWSPIDEFNHFLYVNYLYYMHRPPKVAMLYEASTNPAAPPALTILPSRGHGVAMAEVNSATEGIQPPGYYALMLPAFMAGRHGTYAQITDVRLATAALAALLIPLTFLLARLAAPNAPWVWGAASVLPALSRGYVFNMSQVTNDPLAIVVGTIAIFGFLWLLRARLDWRWGAVAGLITAAVVLTKGTIYFIPLVYALVFVVRVIRARGKGQWPAAAVVGLAIASIIPAPWLALEYHRYHGLAPATDISKAPAVLLPYFHLPLKDALISIVERGSMKFWSGEMGPIYPPLWLLAVGETGLILCLLGFANPSRWRVRPLQVANWVFLWTGAGLAFLLGLVFLSQVAILTGRYVYPLFAGIGVCCAVGANQLGRPGRWLFIASVAVLAVAAAIALPPAVSWSLQGCTDCPLPPISP